MHTETEQSPKSVVLVSTISKSGKRLVIGVPKRYSNEVEALKGKPVRVKLETLL